jgi:hypothetical protein
MSLIKNNLTVSNNYDPEVHAEAEEPDEDSQISYSCSTSKFGCAGILIALGIMIAIIKIASAIASGAIPPPW